MTIPAQRRVFLRWDSLAGGCLILVCLQFPAFASDSTAGLAEPAPSGELWRVATTIEYYGARDRDPSRRQKKTTDVCMPASDAGGIENIAIDPPDSLKAKCWVKSKRAESGRAQVKYACVDGSSIEAVVRRTSVDEMGSQLVVNIPGQGGLSITRELRRSAMACHVRSGPPSRSPLLDKE